MRELVRDSEEKSQFIEYIRAVINHFTPEIPQYSGEFPANWMFRVFKDRPLLNWYAVFVGSLLNLNSIEHRDQRGDAFRFVANRSSKIKYSIVTLNYDMVVENISKHLLDFFHQGGDPAYSEFPVPLIQGKPISIAKLHGSADSREIVPPTWNKSLRPELLSAWKAAFNSLRNANYLRIVGYSLPTADAYVKYLLKAASVEAEHLKKIDILCFDRTGEIKQRYSEFLVYPNVRFASGDFRRYLESLARRSEGEASITIDGLVTHQFNKFRAYAKRILRDGERN